jgi:hypothetical protein
MSYTIWAIPEDSFEISGNLVLSGFSQGDGSHLVGATITWKGGGWEQIFVTDDDENFDDNDRSQLVTGNVLGVNLLNGNWVIEAEYTIVLQGPDGTLYTAIGVNVNEPGGSPAFGTVEGLAFIGDRVPPPGVALTVVSAGEGPGSFGVLPLNNEEYYAPPCFTQGVLIRTPQGDRRPVESLRPGISSGRRMADRSRSDGFSQRGCGAAEIAADRSLRPILLRAHALGEGRPERDLRVSPQHRILISGWRASLNWGAEELLVPARALVDGVDVVVDDEATDVTYYHLVFERHEIVASEGLLSESYLPGELTLRGLSEEDRAAVAGVFSPARPGIGVREGTILAPARAESGSP